MVNTKPDIQRFIARLSDKLGTPLTLQNGVCALYDHEQRQVAVIELPEHSDSVVFHCRLGGMQKGAGNLQDLLEMNFDVSTLRGCWFALDQGGVRLCTQRELTRLDEEQFCHVVTGFMAQVQETRATLSHLWPGFTS